MDDKTWELLIRKFDDLDATLKEVKASIYEVKAENLKQTQMINKLKVTVAGISSTVTIFVTFLKSKFFGT